MGRGTLDPWFKSRIGPIFYEVVIVVYLTTNQCHLGYLSSGNILCGSIDCTGLA